MSLLRDINDLCLAKETREHGASTNPMNGHAKLMFVKIAELFKNGVALGFINIEEHDRLIFACSDVVPVLKVSP